jgi:hypothetical protein
MSLAQLKPKKKTVYSTKVRLLGFILVAGISLSLSLSHTHTHTHIMYVTVTMLETLIFLRFPHQFQATC